MYEAEKKARRYDRIFGQRLLKPLVPFLLQRVPAEPGEVWLDWECGPGALTSLLLKRLPARATLLVSDRDRAALRIFHNNVELDTHPQCFVKQDEPEHLGLAEGVVDLAFGHWRWQMIDHPAAGVVELCRVLKPGGVAILSFLLPGSGGSLAVALKAARAHDIATALEQDGLPTTRVREYLRAGQVAQIQVHTIDYQLVLGQSMPPMANPLLLEFLLPRWLSHSSGQEISSIDSPPFNLGQAPLTWELKMGIAVATMPAIELAPNTRTPKSPQAGSN